MSKLAAARLVLALLGVAAGLAYLSGPSPRVGRAAPKADPDRAPEVREIQLSAIYSTIGQRKLTRVYDAFDADTPEWDALPEIARILREAKSPPTLAVVRGDSGKEAVLATARHVRLKKSPAEPIGPDDKSTSKKYWLFVYLGSGHSGPLKWRVYPPTVYGAKVQFSYARFDGWFLSEPDEMYEITGDDRAYEYWVPLGTFEDPSQLKAELVELTKKVTVTYPAPTKPKK